MGCYGNDKMKGEPVTERLWNVYREGVRIATVNLHDDAVPRFYERLARLDKGLAEEGEIFLAEPSECDEPERIVVASMHQGTLTIFH